MPETAGARTWASGAAAAFLMILAAGCTEDVDDDDLEQEAPVLCATLSSSSTIDLRWEWRFGVRESWTVERSTDGIQFAPIASLGLSQSQFTDDPGSGWNSLWYRVKGARSATRLSNVCPVTRPWSRTFGATGDETLRSMQATRDGGWVVAGTTTSFGAGCWDAWVLKLDALGHVEWERSFGGAEYDWAAYVIESRSGGFVVVGGVNWTVEGLGDCWIFELNAEGSLLWELTFGGDQGDEACGILETATGGYLVTATTSSFGAGSSDLWLLKFDATRQVVWQKALGGGFFDGKSDDKLQVLACEDGGYIMAACTLSFGAGDADFWIVKVSEEGGILWEKAYGGPGRDGAFSIDRIAGEGYLVAGGTKSFGSIGRDFWVLKLDLQGNVFWEKRYGGYARDQPFWVRATPEGGSLVAGITGSTGNGQHDLWFLKLEPSGEIKWQRTYGAVGDDLSYSAAFAETADGGIFVATRTEAFGAGAGEIWAMKLASDGSIDFDPASGLAVRNSTVVPVTSACIVTETRAQVMLTTAMPSAISGATLNETRSIVYSQTR